MADADVFALSESLSDRYRIEKEIGAGGMATVYLAHDLKHNRQVAIKVLRRDLAASLGPARFHSEIQIAAGLQHPHIVPLYDSGAAAGRLYYVMPYVDGPSLRSKLMREGELPISDAVRILRDVADALAAAHKHGVVHRDLKPENVMLSGRHALVTDFGVAKALSNATGAHGLTTEGVALGTPAYMSPEQASADPHTDHRADVYAFGVLAYEMLTGRTPFSGTTAAQILSAHVTQPADPITKHRAAIPPVLSALVMRCLEKRPADRWQSADELIPQLEAVLTPSGGMTPTGTQSIPGFGASSPSRRLQLGITSLVGIVVVVAVVLALFGRGRGVSALANQRIVVAWLENQTRDSSLADIGALAAGWIIDGLSRQNMGELVSSSAVRDYMQDSLAASASKARDLAARTRAGLLVSGSYFKRGDTIEYRAELLDVAHNGLVASVGPFRGTRNGTAPLDSLFQSVAIAIGDKLNFAMSDSAAIPWQQASSLAAWREFLTAQEVFVAGKQFEALEIARRVSVLDPSWWSPRFMGWSTFANASQWKQADSVLAVARAYRDHYRTFDRNEFDYAYAVTHGDLQAAYRSAKLNQALAPRAGAYRALLISARVGRSREALQYYTLRDTTFWGREWGGWDSQHRRVLHHLGEFVEEVKADLEVIARRGNTLATAQQLVRALAAAGRRAEVDSVIAVWRDSPKVGALAPGDLYGTAGREYRAHGDTALARDAFEKRLDWYTSRATTQRAANAGFAVALASALFDAGRYGQARTIYDSLSKVAPNNIERLGMLGATAALAGDLAAARAVDARLSSMEGPYLNGENTWWRAWIAAYLGECGVATQTIRDAHAAGQYVVADLHWYASIGKARDCKSLQQEIGPKG